MGAQYRLWSFVTDTFVIRALCQGAFVCMCMYVLRAGEEMGFIVFFSQLVLISAIYMELYNVDL